MKCQALFSLKVKVEKVKVPSAAILLGSLSLKIINLCSYKYWSLAVGECFTDFQICKVAV